MKMLITLEPDGIFGSNFVYLCIFKLSSHWYEKKVKRLHRASFWPVEHFSSKSSKLLNQMVYLVQILYTYVLKSCPATGIITGEEASPSIILASRALLVKMLIILEPHYAFGSNF